MQYCLILFKYDCDNIYFGCPLLVFQGISDLLFSMCTFFNYLLFDNQHDPIRTKDKGENHMLRMIEFVRSSDFIRYLPNQLR